MIWYKVILFPSCLGSHKLNPHHFRLPSPDLFSPSPYPLIPCSWSAPTLHTWPTQLLPLTAHPTASPHFQPNCFSSWTTQLFPFIFHPLLSSINHPLLTCRTHPLHLPILHPFLTSKTHPQHLRLIHPLLISRTHPLHLSVTHALLTCQPHILFPSIIHTLPPSITHPLFPSITHPLFTSITLLPSLTHPFLPPKVLAARYFLQDLAGNQAWSFLCCFPVKSFLSKSITVHSLRSFLWINSWYMYGAACNICGDCFFRLWLIWKFCSLQIDVSEGIIDCYSICDISIRSITNGIT